MFSIIGFCVYYFVDAVDMDENANNPVTIQPLPNTVMAPVGSGHNSSFLLLSVAGRDVRSTAEEGVQRILGNPLHRCSVRSRLHATVYPTRSNDHRQSNDEVAALVVHSLGRYGLHVSNLPLCFGS